MGNNHKGKQKLLPQRHVCFRMNFLYQAANLMAHSNNNTLAAYYGMICRNVGTKSLMRMSPAMKRTLCKLCALPLLPGVNTTLELEEKQKQSEQQKPIENLTATSSSKPRSRRRRLRGKGHKSEAERTAPKNDILDDQARLQLECILCGTHRRFAVDIQNECWLERSDAVAEVLPLERQTDEDSKKQKGDEEGDEL